MTASSAGSAAKNRMDSDAILSELAKQAGRDIGSITTGLLSEWFRQGMCPPATLSKAADSMASLAISVEEFELLDITPEGETVWMKGNGASGQRISHTIPEMAATWNRLPKAERPEFPMSTVVKSFLKQPRTINLNSRKHARTMPAKLAMVYPGDPRASLFSAAAHFRQRGKEQLVLPGFEKDDVVTPVIPLLLYDLSIGENNSPGPGAPLALRLFVESILAVNMAEQANEGPVAMSVPLRTLLEWLYPGNRRPRPAEYWPRLVKAAEVLDSQNARIPWYDPQLGRGGSRRVVSVGDIPRGPECLDDEVQIIVNLPPGSGSGPEVSQKLRHYGTKSAVAYRLLIHFAYRWHHPGSTLINTGKKGGKPRWERVYDPDSYEYISDAELAKIAFPFSTRSNTRKLNQLTRKWRDTLVKDGEMQIVDGKILPPPPS